LAGKAPSIELSRCLVILAIAQLVNAATGPVATSLYMKGEVAFFAGSVIVSALFNIAGNLALVPDYGAVGAATSTATAIANLAQYLRARYLRIA
jgi:O-antigen/teichoic acid export membrane protein